MKTCIIIHGKPSDEEYLDMAVPSPSNQHWIPRAQKMLLTHEIFAQTPKMPTPYAPIYSSWERVLDQFILDTDTTLVGHSCGGGFLLRYLSQHTLKVRALILVAPWLDPARRFTRVFFDFAYDPKLTDRVGSLHVLFSTDDMSTGVAESTQQIRTWYPSVSYHEFTDQGHFVEGERSSRDFPELINIILSL